MLSFHCWRTGPGSWSFFRALQVLLMSPGLRSCCLAAQQPGGWTIITRGHQMQQKKVEETAEEQIGGSCLTWEGGTVGSKWTKEESQSRDIFRTELSAFALGLVCRRQEKRLVGKWGVTCWSWVWSQPPGLNVAWCWGNSPKGPTSSQRLSRPASEGRVPGEPAAGHVNKIQPLCGFHLLF